MQQIERPPDTNWFRFHSTAGSGRVDPQLPTETAVQTFDSAAHLWRYFAFYNSGAYAVGTASDFVYQGRVLQDVWVVTESRN
jgi:hypothetical protein